MKSLIDVNWVQKVKNDCPTWLRASFWNDEKLRGSFFCRMFRLELGGFLEIGKGRWFMVILLAFKNKLDVYSIRSRGYDNLKVLSDDFSALLSRTVNSEATAKAVANYTENEKGLKMSLIIMATMIITVVAVSLTVFFYGDAARVWR